MLRKNQDFQPNWWRYRLAGALLKYKKGDVIHITGKLKANQWTDKEGVEQNAFQIVNDGLMGVKAAKI